jgi:hypothetical protein
MFGTYQQVWIIKLLKLTYIYLLGSVEELLPAVHVRWLRVLPAEVLCHLPGGELCLADVAKVSGQVDCLTLYQAGQQGHISRLPSTRWQGEADAVKFTAQHLASVLGLGSESERELIYALIHLNGHVFYKKPIM